MFERVPIYIEVIWLVSNQIPQICLHGGFHAQFVAKVRRLSLIANMSAAVTPHMITYPSIEPWVFSG